MATTITVTPVDVGTTPGDNTGDSARVAFQAVNANEANFKAGIEAIREPLTANRTYYVRTDGNDSTNDGLTDSAGGAFLTIQKAVDVTLDTLDQRGYVVTVNVADGTYTAGINVQRSLPKEMYITGNTTTPANCIISTTSANCVTYGNGGSMGGHPLILSGFEFRTTTSGFCIQNSGGHISLNTAIRFGACALYHIYNAAEGSVTALNSNYEITGAADEHMLCARGNIVSNAGTCTITGSPAIGFFARATGKGYIYSGTTYTGVVTGQRYACWENGTIETTGGANHFPGTVAGNVIDQGMYNGISNYREPLTANRTYYVRTDGVDTNTGLVNSAGGAFLTIQRAVDVVCTTIDGRGYTVTIQVGAGTYTAGIVLYPTNGLADTNDFIIKGDTTTPSNCVISTSADCFTAFGANIYGKIEGFKFVSSAGSGLSVGNGALVHVGAVEFGACSYAHIDLYDASLSMTANYSITGAATYHINADGTSGYYCIGRTVTMSGTLAFTTFIVMYDGAYAFCGTTTYTGGTITGQRYAAEVGGIISGTGGSSTFFPGNAAGGGTDYNTITAGLYL